MDGAALGGPLGWLLAGLGTTEMKGFIMRTGTAARRNRILESLSKERQDRVKELKEQIEQGSYVLRGKIELVFDDMLDEVVRSRN